jgi:hypothetical protein
MHVEHVAQAAAGQANMLGADEIVLEEKDEVHSS